MTVDQAILTLQEYNDWRKGSEEARMPSPRLVTEAINIATHSMLNQLRPPQFSKN